MTSNDCNCAPTLLDSGFSERPRFFPRQLVTPDDLTLGQDYFRDKMRRHNRYLHGWGVVCGAKVSLPATPRPFQVVIQKGYVLGPYGDEILIDQDLCFDVRARCMTATRGDVCSELNDPLCSDEVDTRLPSQPLFIAIRYKEIPTRPVRVQPIGCGCDDTHCEFSRFREGYEICVLSECPESHRGSPPAFASWIAAEHPECPPCPSDPWVVLARFKVDAQGNIEAVDNCACRRTVLSLASYWTRCADATIKPPVEPGPKVEPNGPTGATGAAPAPTVPPVRPSRG